MVHGLSLSPWFCFSFGSWRPSLVKSGRTLCQTSWKRSRRRDHPCKEKGSWGARALEAQMGVRAPPFRRRVQEATLLALRWSDVYSCLLQLRTTSLGESSDNVSICHPPSPHAEPPKGPLGAPPNELANISPPAAPPPPPPPRDEAPASALAAPTDEKAVRGNWSSKDGWGYFGASSFEPQFVVRCGGLTISFNLSPSQTAKGGEVS